MQAGGVEPLNAPNVTCAAYPINSLSLAGDDAYTRVPSSSWLTKTLKKAMKSCWCQGQESNLSLDSSRGGGVCEKFRLVTSVALIVVMHERVCGGVGFLRARGC